MIIDLNWIVQGGWREDPIQRRTIHWIENFPGDGGVLELKCNIWIFFSLRGQEFSCMWRTKKNLVDKKIGIEVCNSLSVQWPTNNCFSNSNDIIVRKRFPKETETRYWFRNIPNFTVCWQHFINFLPDHSEQKFQVHLKSEIKFWKHFKGHFAICNFFNDILQKTWNILIYFFHRSQSCWKSPFGFISCDFFEVT